MTSAESRGRNVEKLRAAGVIEEGLPEAYHPVFESLSDEELALILQVKARLDDTKRGLSDAEDYAGFVPF
jgi:hypothetical protein